MLAVGIAVAGATGGTAFAAPGRYSHPSPDGGATVRSFDVPAPDSAGRPNNRKAGRAAAQPKADPAKKPKSTAKAKAKAKARANAAVAQRNRVARRTTAKPKATWKAPAATAKPPAATAEPPAAAPPAVTAQGGVGVVGAPGVPAGVTVTAVGPAALAVSWTPDAATTAAVAHYVATAVEDPAKTCRTPTNAETSCVVHSLAGGGAYSFTVRAIGVPGAGDSAPSAASAPATAGEANDGMLDTTGPAAAHQAAAAQHTTAARQPAGIVKHDSGTRAGPVRVEQQAGRGRGLDKARDKALDKARDTPRQAGTGEPRDQAFGAATGGRLGLPRGSAGQPAMTDADRPQDRGSTGTLVLLGLGTLFAGLAAFGVTLVRRR